MEGRSDAKDEGSSSNHELNISFFPFLFFSVLLKYNWHIALYEFQAYSIKFDLLPTLWNDDQSLVRIHHLIQIG